jgi:hypothetical protein
MICCKPIIPIFEFDISNDIFIPGNEDVNIPIVPETDIDLLKDKIICEYKLIISELEQGRRPNLDFLLEEISLVELNNEVDNREFYIQYYLNNTK